MQRIFVFGLAAAVLGGCSAAVVTSMPHTDFRQGGPAKSAQFATEIAGPNTYLAPMPTAVVLLKPDDMVRNRAFCLAFAKVPTAQAAEAAQVIAPNLIRTRWLMQLSEVPEAKATDCEYLVGAYDYARAGAVIASLRAGGTVLDGPGPYLAMIIPDNAGLKVAAVDGSTYQPAQFDAFVASWKRALDQSQSALTARGTQPGLVRSIFDLAFAALRTVFGTTTGVIQGGIPGGLQGFAAGL